MQRNVEHSYMPSAEPLARSAARVSCFIPLAVLLLAGLAATGCRGSTRSQDLSSLSITLERTACEGFCPVYSVTLHGDGQVEYLGERYVDIPGPQKVPVQQEQLKALLATFNDIHFFELKESYFVDCTDLPTAIITISLEGKSKRVSNYFGCGAAKSGPPGELFRLAEQIDAVAGSGRWVQCDTECVKRLAQTGFDVNAQAPDGDTALLIAVQKRDAARIRALLDAGAQVNLANGQGTTPLMYATMANNPEIVRELLAHSAKTAAKDKKGFTALDMAGGKEVRQLLIHASAKK